MILDRLTSPLIDSASIRLFPRQAAETASVSSSPAVRWRMSIKRRGQRRLKVIYIDCTLRRADGPNVGNADTAAAIKNWSHLVFLLLLMLPT